MKCLSLWQPHAIAIGLGIRKFETRGWALPASCLNVPMAIHASKHPFRERDYPWEWFKEARDRLRAAGVSLGALDYGKIVCLCLFTACLPTGKVRGRIGDAEFWGDFGDVGEDETGKADGKPRFAFKIARPRLIPAEHRLELAGRQGIFNLPPDVEKEMGLWW